MEEAAAKAEEVVEVVRKVGRLMPLLQNNNNSNDNRHHLLRKLIRPWLLTYNDNESWLAGLFSAVPLHSNLNHALIRMAAVLMEHISLRKRR